MASQLLSIINGVASFYIMLIFVYTIMTWFPLNGFAFDLFRVLGSLCEPYIGVFRRLLPSFGGLDFSPWAAILAIQFVIVPLARYAVLALVSR